MQVLVCFTKDNFKDIGENHENPENPLAIKLRLKAVIKVYSKYIYLFFFGHLISLRNHLAFIVQVVCHEINNGYLVREKEDNVKITSKTCHSFWFSRFYASFRVPAMKWPKPLRGKPFEMVLWLAGRSAENRDVLEKYTRVITNFFFIIVDS